LPENLPVYPEMTIADYLDYAADLKGFTGTEKSQEISRVIKATDLSAKLLAPIETLSRGFKQRVGVAQAILGSPKILILDEPTNGLDPRQTEQMRVLIKSIAQNATVILSTHIMQEVDALCDRVLIVNGGKLVVDSKLEALRQSDTLHLTTSMSGEDVLMYLNPINGVDNMTRLDSKSSYPDANDYEITINKSDGHHNILASIAKAIIDTGNNLYRLTEVHRDLETVFREVSDPSYQRTEDVETNQQEVSYAA
jgi:ABC-2 type transport system ATP-binding protein